MEYKLKYRKGIDDLRTLYAFHGNSQGDTHRTNSIQEYIDSKGWLSFVFDCKLDDYAIAQRVKANHLSNLRYIEQLEKEGKFGEIAELSINIQHNPVFDDPNTVTQPEALSSYKMVFLDLK